MPRGKRGEQDERTNWSLRDNVTWYTDQVKSAPGAVKALASVPGNFLRGVRGMAADMRSAPPAISPNDPSLAPIDGITFAMLVRATAAMMHRQIPEGDAAARDALAQTHGVPAGGWSAGEAAWERRMAQDPRLAEAFAWGVRAELARLRG